MNNSNFTTREPIEIVCLDPLLHGPWNNYYCPDRSCPCKDDTTWTGSMLSVHRAIEQRQQTAKQQDLTPTEVLPPAPKAYQSLIEDGGETWRLNAPRRRRRSWWRRLWRW